MPRQVDHAQRRAEIAHAVWALAASRGLDAVSMRTVAAEAGVSAGRVQHYFASKDEMVLFAARAMTEAASRAAAVDEPSPPREAVRRALVLGIPRDESGRVGAAAWFAFVAKAAVWPELAEVVSGELHGARTWFVGQLRRASRDGQLRSGIDPDGAGLALPALADGLVLRVLAGAVDPAEATRLVDTHLDEIFAAPA